LLGFLTKQYYALVIPAVGFYLFFFVSKKKAIVYSLISVVSLILLLIILDSVFPMYLNNTIAVHLRHATYSYQYMKDQVAVFFEVNVFLTLLIVLSVIVIVWEYLSKRAYMTVNEIVLDIRKLFKMESISQINKPLIRTNADFLFILTLLLALFIFMINLGGHKGNYMAAYLFQLASPFLVLVTFQVFDFTKDLLFRSFACFLLIITLNTEFDLQKIEFDRYTSCFNQIETIIQASRNPLNSPENVSIMLKEGKNVYNTGHSEYFFDTSRMSNTSGITLNQKSERLENFKQEISHKIVNKDFDVILLTQGYYSFFVDKQLLYQNYSLKNKLCAPTILQEWTTEIWEPKK
jgi:hypothetical protein